MKTFKYLSRICSDMAEVIVKIPDELKELQQVSGINWQLAVEKRLREEFTELAQVKKKISKSALSEEQAKRLADEVNASLAKKYKKLLK